MTAILDTIRKEIEEMMTDETLFEENAPEMHESLEKSVSKFLDLLIKNRRIEGYVVDVMGEAHNLHLRGSVLIDGKIHSIQMDLKPTDS